VAQSSAPSAAVIFDAQAPLAETETQPPISYMASDLATESG